MMSVQEKFIAAKSLMENELSQLRAQSNSKSVQLQQISDELSKLKVSLSDMSTEKFRLEAHVSELTANESSQSRIASSIQAQLKQRDQEIQMLSGRLIKIPTYRSVIGPQSSPAQQSLEKGVRYF
jgi:chromosome segregation ATPase